MCEQLTPTNCQQLSLCMGATHANHLAKQGSAQDMPTSATCGPQCSGLCRCCDPLGWLVKMLQATLPSASMPFAMTWKQQATPSGRLLFRLAPQAPRIRESGFSYWPTPRATDWKDPRGKTGNRPAASAAKAGWTLSEAARGFGGTAADGVLNPEWVEWLMGFPPGWTDVKD